MMKMFVLCVRDRAADVFGQPMFVASIGGAIRSFADEINSGREKSVMSQHPDDFDLYEMGSFTDQTGKFELLDSPRMIAVGKDCVK